MDTKYLQELLKMSQQNQKQLDLNVKIFDQTFGEVLKNAPVEDVGVLEKMRILTTKAINLAKEGKQTEAQDVLNQIKNECKSSK